mgnify:CR=1 FL=1
MKKTKIICTMGPRTMDKIILKELIAGGMNVARFNFSHGSYEEHAERIALVRQVSEQLGIPVALMLDTKGPEIRTGLLKDGKKVSLEQGKEFTLYTEEREGDETGCSITYQQLVYDVRKGDTILIDDGLIEMKVVHLDGTDIVCEVINGGMISNKKGVNVPNVELSMPFISETDYSDIVFGIKNGFDFIAASFTRTADDILQIRKILEEHDCKSVNIIAKIENKQGVDNIDDIIRVSDGIMVARGDMGVEIPLEEVPILQKKMIKMAVAQGKHVITATQMLESMIKNPRPTRAEATDIANAIYDGTTAIMLSGESAAGLYPVEAVKTMSRIAERAEQDIDYRGRMQKVKEDRQETPDITTAISYATCSVASDLNAAAIITVTMSGFTANMIARYKPGCQIIGCTLDEKVYRQLNLLWGVKPVMIQKERTTDALFEEAVFKAKQAGLVKTGDTVVITAGVPLGVVGKTDMIHVVEVE